MYTRLNTARLRQHTIKRRNQLTSPWWLILTAMIATAILLQMAIALSSANRLVATRTTQMSLPWACLRIVSWLVLQPTASAIQSAIRPRIDGPRTAIPETAGSRKHRAKTCTLSLFICRTFFKSFQTLNSSLQLHQLLLCQKMATYRTRSAKCAVMLHRETTLAWWAVKLARVSSVAVSALTRGTPAEPAETVTSRNTPETAASTVDSRNACKWEWERKVRDHCEFW